MNGFGRLLNRALSRGGSRAIIGGLGAVYVSIAARRVFLQAIEGVSIVDTSIVTLLIAIPGFVLLYGSYWLSRSDIDAEFYADIASWCVIGFGVMASVLLAYHLQPGESISNWTTSLPILTALSSATGFLVGIYDSQAKSRTRQLERRNEELERTQREVEKKVDQLEEANRRLEHYKKYTDEVLGAIDDIFYVLSEDGSLQRWNERLYEVTGYSEAEVGSMNAIELFDESDHERIADKIAEGFETGSAQVEARLRTRDGAYLPYEFVASTLENPRGDTRLAGIGRDIRPQKDRERALEQRARQQQAVANLGQFALENDDLDQLMREAARQVADVLDNEYCKVLDLDDRNDELLLRQGVGWKDGHVGEAVVSAVEADSQAAYTLQSNRAVVVEDLESETRFSGPDLLRDHHVKSGISIIIGSVEKPWGILGTHDVERRTFTEEDVNFVQSIANILAEAIERQQYNRELERLIDSLEESNERLEQFAYAASHDLQEPLRMVSSYLQLIERRYGDTFDDEGREFLEFAVDGADRMRSMIEGLLHYSRVETRGEPFERVDLKEVFDDIYEDLQFMIRSTEATITTDTLPPVHGDPAQLRQAFQNLVKNALQYGGDKPPVVHVSARRDGTKWIVSVRDEGIGIAPGDQERVFDVFERAHDRSQGNGNGIGLALCKRIIERHNGDVWIESSVGAGTTVSVSLPAMSRAKDT